ncbi:hypothetical protein PUNSTDRAFT_69821 [Punctularia strigosozonata HHB-11173 SS5]|uniref:uncharacterized protein n=1 Tax=Punctularia strigosozonata (strain HHB-11173) TaxID=741275 RepID=UPI0004416C8C|nr:uncharacterized protein PUNSTDRAFT_69821 [Punctularia strigosozonata HHB-11173 SS5]EIN07547.1 hypothetical protein PUNSTDRAFT_69821 [Punctularia strigosozonata HHB-11173 SS5]
MEAEVGGGIGASAGRYRPPALRALASQTSDLPSATNPSDAGSLPPSNYPPGFRRARAGTLPSNVHLAAQRFAAASSTLGSTPGSTESFAEQLQMSAQTPPAVNPVRPNLRHTASVATSIPSSALGERHARLRSGSLTLPSQQSMSNAFGSSLFSSGWVPDQNGGAGAGGMHTLDEMRSVASMDSGADDFDVHTLDYLGLADGQRPATISQLRNQAQAAITGNIPNPSSRARASTVSNPYRQRLGAGGSLLGTPHGDEEDMYDDYASSAYTRQRVDSYDAGSYFPPATQIAKGFKHGDHLAPETGPLGSRQRAVSVGTLEDPVRGMQRRASVAGLLNSGYINEYQGNVYNAAGHAMTPSGILKSDRAAAVGRAAATSVHFPGGDLAGDRASPYLQAPSNQGRAVSPKSEGSSSQTQTPTRSLWIGNLDSSVTSEQLIHVFAPYGAIESLRLLPEKECGFVNFVDMADAIRAKDEVLNRLGGNIGMPNGQTVRIGFGKADSAPLAPGKGNNVSSPTPTTPGALTKSPGTPSGVSGMDAQLQSTPTRALWIGSIPSTTTPAAILSVFSPYGPIESARVLTHKNCGFINFERLDDAVRARKALNGRDILGSDVGAIRIGFAKVPVKNAAEGASNEDGAAPSLPVGGIGELSVGASIHALRNVKGASAIPTDQQVLSGAVENYRSNLLLSMLGSGAHTIEGLPKPGVWPSSVTEQQMIFRELSGGAPDAEQEIVALAEFRPPTMYYTTIPLVSERPNTRRWDASKLRELRKRMDSNSMTLEEIDATASEFLDSEIVDLASDWLGNTVVQKLFEKCSPAPRMAMLERLSPHLAMIGIHKNGTWAAQKIIECVQTPEEVALIAQNLRPYGPPLLLDQFGNYVVQCCLRFGSPANDFIFDAMVDRLWEIAQGRFGARSMRACLESPLITINQQRRVATAIILNSIPLTTNPNGALLLTWLLDTSGFPSRYNLLAPRFTPHLSHLCTHKLASLTVLRIVNQKVEPEASAQIVDALFNSPGDHVLTDVLGDQVNGVAVVHKILTTPFIDPAKRPQYIEATKRVLIELKVIATQAYRRLIEEVGLPIPNFQPTYNNVPPPGTKGKLSNQNSFGVPGLPSAYANNDQGLASLMASLQMAGQNPHSNPHSQLAIDPAYGQQQQLPPQPPQAQNNGGRRATNPNASLAFSPTSDPFNPFGMRSPDVSSPGRGGRRNGNLPPGPSMSPGPVYQGGSPGSLSQAGNMLGMGQPAYGVMGSPQAQSVQPPLYQNYMYQLYQQNPPGMTYQ